MDPEKVPRKLSKYRTKDVTYVASLEVSCDGMKVTSAYLEGITNAFFAEITIEDPTIKLETHSDCVNDRLVVSHVGYVYAVMKKRVGIDVSVGSTGGGAGGTADSQIIKFPVYSGPLDCGPCDCDE